MQLEISPIKIIRILYKKKVQNPKAKETLFLKRVAPLKNKTKLHTILTVDFFKNACYNNTFSKIFF